jgi:hypothetical protein
MRKLYIQGYKGRQIVERHEGGIKVLFSSVSGNIEIG